MKLIDLTIETAHEGLIKKKFSALDLAESAMEAIKKSEDKLHSFITVAEVEALAAAKKVDERIKAGDSIDILAGIPMGVKDVILAKDVLCTASSNILANYVAAYDATIIKKLKDCNSVMAGKTNCDAFAHGASTENSDFGPSRNPWDLERTPGGSSGGSASAVAGGEAIYALGTDTGGSVRQPASFCGVTGLKPTYGRVSRYGLVAYGSSLDCVGVLARTAEDVAILYTIMAGRDPLDATTAEVPVPKVDFAGLPPERSTGRSRSTQSKDAAPLRGLRIGVPQEYFVRGIQAEVEVGVRKAIGVLEGLGVEVHEISLPHTEYALPVYYIIAPAEASANLARYDGIRYGPRLDAESMWDIYYRTRGRKFGAEVERRIMLGTYALSAGYYEAYYGQAQKVRTLIKHDFKQAFEPSRCCAQVDAIAAPVAPTTAFPIGAHGDDPLAMYLEDVFTLPANLAGVPGLAFPVGFDGAGLPVGMQLMGKHFHEDVLLRMAHAYQQVTDWHVQKPKI